MVHPITHYQCNSGDASPLSQQGGNSICLPHTSKEWTIYWLMLSQEITFLYFGHCILRQARSRQPFQGSVRPAAAAGTRLDLQTLDESVEFYFRSGLAQHKEHMHQSRDVTVHFAPLMVASSSRHQNTRYAGLYHHLTMTNCVIIPLKCYLAGVRHLHIAEGFGNPKICDMARLEQVMRGIRTSQAKGAQKRLVRLPITPHLLYKLSVGKQWGWAGRMMWAASVLCFFGFLRSGVDSEKLASG